MFMTLEALKSLDCSLALLALLLFGAGGQSHRVFLHGRALEDIIDPFYGDDVPRQHGGAWKHSFQDLEQSRLVIEETPRPPNAKSNKSPGALLVTRPLRPNSGRDGRTSDDRRCQIFTSMPDRGAFGSFAAAKKETPPAKGSCVARPSEN